LQSAARGTAEGSYKEGLSMKNYYKLDRTGQDAGFYRQDVRRDEATVRVKAKALPDARRIPALCVALLLMLSLFVHAQAASKAVSTITGELRPNVTVLIDGTARTFYNVQGQAVYPLFYNGTHYLPVRAIGELMGKNVNWDESSLTISLAGSRTSEAVTGTKTNESRRSVTAESRPDFTITVDGVIQIFYDEQDKRVYPLLYNGTTYLPVRAISEMMGKSVTWNESTMTIALNTRIPSTARTAGSATDTSTQSSSSYIGESKAQSIALTDAKLTAAAVSGLHTSLDAKDSEYDVKFYTGTIEYEYEIDAVSGQIISREMESSRDTTPSTGTSSNSATTSTTSINADKAASIALADAGLTASSVTGLHTEYDRDDAEYDVEFYAGSKEYEYEIDSRSGKILSRDVETNQNASATTSTTSINADKAASIALADAGLTTSSVTGLHTEYDRDDAEYDVEFYAGAKEYEYEIDALSGKIISCEVETKH
jgi:uncharacterized membrane protein YkoI